MVIVKVNSSTLSFQGIATNAYKTVVLMEQTFF